jgi:hypothetical protein
MCVCTCVMQHVINLEKIMRNNLTASIFKRHKDLRGKTLTLCQGNITDQGIGISLFNRLQSYKCLLRLHRYTIGYIFTSVQELPPLHRFKNCLRYMNHHRYIHKLTIGKFDFYRILLS